MIKRVLILDFNPDYFRGLTEKLEGIEFDLCSNVKNAVSLFKHNFYGLILIDLNLLGREILEFMENIRQGNFYGEILFSGDYQNVEVQKKISALKKLKVLIKPIDMSWLYDQIDGYFHKNISIGNSVDDIDVEFFLRLLNLGKCTVTLKTSCLDGSGTVQFENGEIVSVKFGKEVNEKALAGILAMCGSKIEILKNRPFFSKNESVGFDYIISESLKMKELLSLGKNPEDNSGGDFLNFLIDNFEELTGKSSGNLVERKLKVLGIDLETFSSEYEIDLIDLCSDEIKDIKKKLIFKKKMVEYLKNREKKRIGRS